MFSCPLGPRVSSLFRSGSGGSAGGSQVGRRVRRRPGTAAPARQAGEGWSPVPCADGVLRNASGALNRPQPPARAGASLSGGRAGRAAPGCGVPPVRPGPAHREDRGGSPGRQARSPRPAPGARRGARGPPRERVLPGGHPRPAPRREWGRGRRSPGNPSPGPP